MKYLRKEKNIKKEIENLQKLPESLSKQWVIAWRERYLVDDEFAKSHDNMVEEGKRHSIIKRGTYEFK